MPFSKRTKDRLRDIGRFDCCEFCCTCCPRLANNGLQAAHIVSDSSGGPDDPDNDVVLCHQCAEVFDRFLKAKIAKAVGLANQRNGTQYSVPPDWTTGEGRRSPQDEV